MDRSHLQDKPIIDKGIEDFTEKKMLKQLQTQWLVQSKRFLPTLQFLLSLSKNKKLVALQFVHCSVYITDTYPFHPSNVSPPSDIVEMTS